MKVAIPVTLGVGRSSGRVALRVVRAESPAAALAGGATRGTIRCVNATIGGQELVDASSTDSGVFAGDKAGDGERMLRGAVSGEACDFVLRPLAYAWRRPGVVREH